MHYYCESQPMSTFEEIRADILALERETTGLPENIAGAWRVTPIRIFISSPQSEFAGERAALRDYIRKDPLARRFFDVFLFEDAPASDRRPDALYLDEVTRCDIYIGLFGLQYGSTDQDGISPTEREYNHASELGKCRLIYVKNVRDQERDSRMAGLIRKAEEKIVRKSFESVEDLRREIHESLVKYLLDNLFPHTGSYGDDRCRSSAEAKDILTCYMAAFRRIYTLQEKMVPFNCRSDAKEMSSREAVRSIFNEGMNILILGPSGCGKTLLAANAALEFCRDVGLAIIISVKHYRGTLVGALDREAYLMDTQSSVKLLSAAKCLNQPILLIIDGYNECNESVRESLTVELSALARRYQVRILITSQIPPARSDLLGLRTINVLPATTDTKVAIAKNAMGVKVLPSQIEHLVGAITSGLEARLVGEVGQQLRLGSSRFALFDAYARRRLQNDASQGIRALSSIAAWLFDHVGFSLSVRDLDRLMDDKDIRPEIPIQLQNAGLLSRHGERVSFVHEMFLDAFAAEAIIRRSSGRYEPVLNALAAPMHAQRQDFIIGAIDEPYLREKVLDGLSDPKSIAVCVSEACGRQAREWAEARYSKLFIQLKDEVREIRFRPDVKEFQKVAFDRDSLATWSKSDRAFLATLPGLIMNGLYLHDVLDTVGALDRRIDEETIRLHSEVQGIPLRDSMFAISFALGSFGLSSIPAISQVCLSVHGGGYRTGSSRLLAQIKKHLRDSLSNGQLYLMLKLMQGPEITGIMTPFLARTIRSRWNDVPVHLALQLMRAAGMCFSSCESDRTALIQAIESLPKARNLFLSTEIVEALGSLGALEQSEIEHQPSVHEQVRRCLADPLESDNCAMAYGIYSSQFDHPFSGAYCETISNLPNHERKVLLIMALNGAEYGAFFLDILIDELASYKDPDAGRYIARFATLPPADSVFPQHDLCIFVTSHITLARIGSPLPDGQSTIDSPCAESLTACGVILYWINRYDLDECTTRTRCQPALNVLFRHRQDAALPAIHQCDPTYSFWASHFPHMPAETRCIVSFFPVEVAELCRCALNRSTMLASHFRHLDRIACFRFAIDVLANHGKNADMSLLRRHVDDPDLGEPAIKALKKIEERFRVS